MQDMSQKFREFMRNGIYSLFQDLQRKLRKLDLSLLEITNLYIDVDDFNPRDSEVTARINPDHDTWKPLTKTAEVLLLVHKITFVQNNITIIEYNRSTIFVSTLHKSGL